MELHWQFSPASKEKLCKLKEIQNFCDDKYLKISAMRKVLAWTAVPWDLVPLSILGCILV